MIIFKLYTCFFSGRAQWLVGLEFPPCEHIQGKTNQAPAVNLAAKNTTGQSRNELPGSVPCSRHPAMFSYRLGCMKTPKMLDKRMWEGKWLLDDACVFLQLQMHICVYHLLTLKLSIPGKGSPRHGASASSLHLSLGDFPIRTGSFCGNDHLVKTSSSWNVCLFRQRISPFKTISLPIGQQGSSPLNHDNAREVRSMSKLIWTWPTRNRHLCPCWFFCICFPHAIQKQKPWKPYRYTLVFINMFKKKYIFKRSIFQLCQLSRRQY